MIAGLRPTGGTSTYDTRNLSASMTTAKGTVLRDAHDGDGKRTDTWFATNTTNTSWAAHTHIDYDAANRVAPPNESSSPAGCSSAATPGSSASPASAASAPPSPRGPGDGAEPGGRGPRTLRERAGHEAPQR